MDVTIDNKTNNNINDILIKAIKVSVVLLGINYAFRVVNRPRPITHNVHIYVHAN